MEQSTNMEDRLEPHNKLTIANHDTSFDTVQTAFRPSVRRA